MEDLEILHLIDFAPLLQLAAGFFVMFIAIDITKSFASLLSTHIYNFKGELSNKISRYRMDKKCLDFFKGQAHFQTGTGRKSLEETNNNIEDLDSKLQQLQESLGKMIDDKCRCDVFRPLSIYMFFYCLFTLLVAGLRKDELLWLHTMAFFTLFSILVVTIAISCNNILKKCNEHNQASIIITTITVIVLITISIYLRNTHLGLSKPWAIFFIDWSVFATVVLPFMVFGTYIIILFCKSLVIRKQINTIDDEVGTLYKKIQKELEDMRGYINQENRELSLITLTEDRTV